MLNDDRPKICIHKTNSIYKNNKIIRRYNESFKLKILSELSKGKYFYSTKYAGIAVKNAIELYNNERLHLSLGYKTPN